MRSRNCPSWTQPRILLTLLLVFLCGSLAGAVSMRYWLRPKVVAAPAYWTQEGMQISLQRLQRELDLTPEQYQQIQQILDDFVKYYHTLHAQMEEVRATGKAKILEVLRPDQREKFQRMLQEMHE